MPVADHLSWSRRLRGHVAIALALAVAVVTIGVTPPLSAHAEAVPATSTPDPATVTADALPTWQINGVVWSQAIVGNTVYVTGSFTKARPPGVPVGGPGEIDALNIFAYDITTGDRVPFDHSLNAQGLVVRAAPDGRRIYVGGDFTTVDGQVRQHIAAFDTATGALVPEFAPRTDGQVRAFGFAGSTVYVGGNFRAANSQPRKLLAAFDAANGDMTPWSPAVDDGYVWAMVMSPDGRRVIVGGSFTSLNTVSAYGMGALDATTGATEAWAANARLRAAGAYGAISSLSTDGTQVYGTGYSFGAGATFEGTFAADPYTGEVKWVNDCLGDTYDIFAIGQVAYNVSHRHDCSTIGLFPDTNPRSRWIKASADRTYPVGTITKKDAYGWDFTGLPYSGSLHWYPDLEFGTYTASRQAAWSVTGNADYVAMAGEFPKVNGVAQQGLVRFTKRPNLPHASGPINNAAFTPAPLSNEAGKVRVVFSSVWDRDDTTIKYDIYRSPGTRIATVTRDDSEFWKLPSQSVLDTGAPAGSSVRYQVRATDPDGNFQWSAWSPYLTVSSAPPSAYVAGVRQAGATHLWRFAETSGATSFDEVGDLHGTNLNMTQGAAGALDSEPNAALTSAGGSATKVTTKDPVSSDGAVSVEAWVKTTSVRGGRIVGFGDSATGTSTSGNTDRVLYLDNSGRVNFAVNNGSYRTIYGRNGVNDGQWHHVVGSIDPTGMQLFVDGVRVGRDQTVTNPKAYAGYWRIGADQTGSFLNRPTDAGLAGSLDEVAVYPKALTKAEVQGNFVLSGRSARWPQPPAGAYAAEVTADAPDLYWRLDEATGNAADAASGGTAGNVSGTVTRGQAGALPDNAATGFNGSTGLVVAQQSWNSPSTYSAELWFKTSSVLGGKLIGFGNAASGLSTSYDRHVTMQSNGRLSFGAASGGQQMLVTTNAYNDNAWHHVVASQGPEGMRLWVDTQLVGSNAVSGAQALLGYWRIGGDRTWGSTLSNYINGTLDEAAVYPRVLSEQDVRDHYQASGRVAVNRPPVAAFTSTVDDLDLSVDASSSTDPDGSVTTFTWDYGDGITGSGVTASHRYATPGTYTVKLTVTDALGLTSTATRPITATANQAPVAAFTSTADFLQVAFDAAGSTDADGSLDSYAWDFGDGSNGSGAKPSHTFGEAGSYVVTLTVTDNDGSTSSVSHQVSVVEAPNQPPSATFTTSVDELAVAFSASQSRDPDGSIASYAWDLGDGNVTTGENATHRYLQDGTYAVKLTVTDNRGGVDTSTKQVAVAKNKAPTAAFTTSVDDLTVSADAADSADADGSISTYAWDFGDGRTASDRLVTHTYDEAGQYTITLTVTDDDGATDVLEKVVTVTAPTVFARDDFGRSVTGGWGSADRGGPWSILSGASRHSVADGVGQVKLAAGTGTTASLASVSSTATEMSVTVAVDKPSTGGGQYTSLIGRQVNGAGDYRAKFRVNATGTVSVWLVKTIGATETVLTSTTVPNLNYAAGESLHLKLQVVGTNSTSLKVKAWKGTSEPTAWALTAADSTESLQTAGGVAIYTFLSGSTTNGPIAFTYDSLLVGVPR